jgi:hypothetical protein
MLVEPYSHPSPRLMRIHLFYHLGQLLQLVVFYGRLDVVFRAEFNGGFHYTLGVSFCL